MNKTEICEQIQKEITLKEVHELLDKCSAVIVDGHSNVLMYPSLSDLEGDDDNEFLFLSWTDDEGMEYQIKAAEGVNKIAKVTNGIVLELIDDEGEAFKLTLLAPMRLDNRNDI